MEEVLDPMTNDGHLIMSQEEIEQSELEQLEYWLDRQGDR